MSEQTNKYSLPIFVDLGLKNEGMLFHRYIIFNLFKK